MRFTANSKNGWQKKRLMTVEHLCVPTKLTTIGTCGLNMPECLRYQKTAHKVTAEYRPVLRLSLFGTQLLMVSESKTNQLDICVILQCLLNYKYLRVLYLVL